MDELFELEKKLKKLNGDLDKLNLMQRYHWIHWFRNIKRDRNLSIIEDALSKIKYELRVTKIPPNASNNYLESRQNLSDSIGDELHSVGYDLKIVNQALFKFSFYFSTIIALISLIISLISLYISQPCNSLPNNP